MDAMPQMSRERYVEIMRRKFEEALAQVADAVNEAPAGRIITDSEEQVRDIFADLRRAAYELAVQMRIDAAEAAFPPSPQRGRAQATQQRASESQRTDDQ